MIDADDGGVARAPRPEPAAAERGAPAADGELPRGGSSDEGTAAADVAGGCTDREEGDGVEENEGDGEDDKDDDDDDEDEDDDDDDDDDGGVVAVDDDDDDDADAEGVNDDDNE